VIEKWAIYPNPTDNLLNIDYKGKKSIGGNISIYNLLGSEVMRKYVTFVSGDNIVLDVSSLNDGVYILVVKDTENRTIKTQKVMINSVK